MRLVMTTGLTLLILALASGAALATGNGNGPPEPHPHMLLLHAEVEIIEGAPYLVGFHKCVDLANNRALPLNAHHSGIHTGEAASAALQGAGHGVVPASPLTPFADCAALENALPIPAGPPPSN